MILFHFTGGMLADFRPGTSRLVSAETVLSHSSAALTVQQRARLAEWLRAPWSGDRWVSDISYEIGTAAGEPVCSVRAIEYVFLMLRAADGAVYEAARELRGQYQWTEIEVAPRNEGARVAAWEATASARELAWRDRVLTRAAELRAAEPAIA